MIRPMILRSVINEMSDTGTVTDDYDDTADDWETADESWEDDSDMTDGDFPG